MRTLESGLTRDTDAPTITRAHALMYRAELAIRLNDLDLARATLDEVAALDLTAAERRAVADELAHVNTLLADATRQ